MNVNITLLFSLNNYETVAEAYIEALQVRTELGEPVDHIASVASFFVSRVDSAVDALLDQKANAADGAEAQRIRALRGKAAIANAKLAYARFQEIFGSDRFAKLREHGAQLQRPLWASTSTKNPEYRDVVYVEELIGPHTVNTMPLATLQAFADHGEARQSVDEDLIDAEATMTRLEELGINTVAVTERLQVEGVEKFVTPYREMLESVDERLARARSGN